MGVGPESRPHCNPSEQELIINAVSEIKQWLKNMSSWAALGLVMSLKKLTVMHERLSSTDESAASSRLPPRLANIKKDSADHENPPKETALSN